MPATSDATMHSPPIIGLLSLFSILLFCEASDWRYRTHEVVNSNFYFGANVTRGVDLTVGWSRVDNSAGRNQLSSSEQEISWLFDGKEQDWRLASMEFGGSTTVLLDISVPSGYDFWSCDYLESSAYVGNPDNRVVFFAENVLIGAYFQLRDLPNDMSQLSIYNPCAGLCQSMNGKVTCRDDALAFPHAVEWMGPSRESYFAASNLQTNFPDKFGPIDFGRDFRLPMVTTYPHLGMICSNYGDEGGVFTDGPCMPTWKMSGRPRKISTRSTFVGDTTDDDIHLSFEFNITNTSWQLSRILLIILGPNDDEALYQWIPVNGTIQHDSPGTLFACDAWNLTLSAHGQRSGWWSLENVVMGVGLDGSRLGPRELDLINPCGSQYCLLTSDNGIECDPMRRSQVVDNWRHAGRLRFSMTTLVALCLVVMGLVSIVLSFNIARKRYQLKYEEVETQDGTNELELTIVEA